MAKFVYIYTGGAMPESPEEGAKVMEAWMTWMAGLGSAITDQGNPFGASTSVTTSGSRDGSSSGASGYTVIAAGSLAEATAKADGCPILAAGGAVEIFEAIEM